METIKQFTHPQFGDVRTLRSANGEPLFVAKDVAAALGYTNPLKAVRDHVSEEDKGMNEMFTPGGIQQLLTINESGLYALILSSKLPQAKAFKHWVTSVVLPQIRMTGGYMPMSDEAGLLNETEILARAHSIMERTLKYREELIAKQEKTIIDQAEQIAYLQPKADYCDQVLDSVSCMTTTQVAKGLGMSAIALNNFLCDHHIQYWQSGQFMLYADYARRGFATNRTHCYMVDGVQHSRSYLVWTEEGRHFIHNLFK